MRIHHLIISVLVLPLLFSGCTSKEKSVTTSLPRSTPEAEGVSSAGILNFLQAADTSRHEFHSFMMLRHGNVIAEGWWNPYRAELKHTMYSVSKSWTSTAAGFAVSEGLLSVEDKVISFFPDQLPAEISDHLKAMRVKDLLSMSAGHEPDPTWAVVTRDTNWIQSYLALPVIKQPGTEFLYNTLATYMVSAILQKVTGQSLPDYLKPRLFDPLGIEGIDWETDPQGIAVGGWGLRVKTEDMAKLGQLYLQNGMWNGKQLLPEAWIKEATSAIMRDSAPYLPDSLKGRSDWAQGYGYQFWRCRHNAFRADGAYGQYIIVMPEQDVVIAITSETADMQGAINLVWEFLLPAITSEPTLPKDNDAYRSLTQKLTTLSLPPPVATVAMISGIADGKKFTMEPNDQDLSAIQLVKDEKDLLLKMTISGSDYDFRFGAGAWRLGETTRRGPYLVTAKNYLTGLPPFKVAGAFTGNERLLELHLRYIESPHAEKIVMELLPDGSIVLTDYPSNLFGKSAYSIKGR